MLNLWKVLYILTVPLMACIYNLISFLRLEFQKPNLLKISTEVFYIVYPSVPIITGINLNL